MPRKPNPSKGGGSLNLCKIHTSLLNYDSKIECPVCDNFRIIKLPLHRFVSPRALMIHISRAHSIPNTEKKKIKRLVRLFEKKQEKSFLKWMKKRGYLI